MSNEWDHLPNAKYIDLVLASVKANPDEWAAAWDEKNVRNTRDTRNAAHDAARCAAYDAAREEAWKAAWAAAWKAAWAAAWDAVSYPAREEARQAVWLAAWDAIAVLIAWDDCAHMLDSEPDDLWLLSKLGVTAATPMILASIAFKLIREKQIVVL